ncbi:hypothetical protein FLL45_04310 [Aliikangiella marina]|uniref:Uncharacterized protein n=1 Tax=Aliikangiella marina TaxID=1712262 RepID=A0A545TJ05_9GAMM|nr:hypothetical protein [Aliikangiella marina]TQV77177.1 hypothetical protein FLL45_04310 [Aliikangiella marina]
MQTPLTQRPEGQSLLLMHFLDLGKVGLDAGLHLPNVHSPDSQSEFLTHLSVVELYALTPATAIDTDNTSLSRFLITFLF